jgi:hypothetical protein
LARRNCIEEVCGRCAGFFRYGLQGSKCQFAGVPSFQAPLRQSGKRISKTRKLRLTGSFVAVVDKKIGLEALLKRT